MTGIEEMIKIYEDGSTGDYYSKCALCNEAFIGHKRDYVCHRHPIKDIPGDDITGEPLK